MMLFILATEYNERGWREAANDGVLTNLTAWEYREDKRNSLVEQSIKQWVVPGRSA